MFFNFIDFWLPSFVPSKASSNPIQPRLPPPSVAEKCIRVPRLKLVSESGPFSSPSAIRISTCAPHQITHQQVSFFFLVDPLASLSTHLSFQLQGTNCDPFWRNIRTILNQFSSARIGPPRLFAHICCNLSRHSASLPSLSMPANPWQKIEGESNSE